MSPNPIRIAEGSPCPSCFDSTRLILAAGIWYWVCSTCKTVKCQGRVRQVARLVLCLLFTFALSACAGDDADNPAAPVAAKPKTDVTFTANAGPDQRVTVGQAVTIVGTLTPEGASICWRLVDKPLNSQTRLTGTNLIVTLTPDKPGGYIVSLGCLDRNEKEYHYYDEMVVDANAAPVVVPDPPAPPTLTVVALHFVSDPLVDGTFSYALESAPTSVNQWGVSNRIYTPLAWHFEVHSAWGDYTFASDQPGHTADVCVGICTFQSGSQIRLNLHDPAGHLLYFSFALPDGVMTLPTLAQIGAFGQGTFRLEDPTPLQVFRTGTMTEAPAPAMSCNCQDGGAL